MSTKPSADKVEPNSAAHLGATVTALAHESRNALQRLQSCLTLLRLRATGPDVHDLLDDMQEAHEELARIYSDIQDVAVPKAPAEPRG